MSERNVEIRCPACGGRDVRPSAHGGLLDSLFRAFQRRPFRCRGCQRRFYRFVQERTETSSSPGGDAKAR